MPIEYVASWYLRACSTVNPSAYLPSTTVSRRLRCVASRPHSFQSGLLKSIHGPAYVGSPSTRNRATSGALRDALAVAQQQAQRHARRDQPLGIGRSEVERACDGRPR